MFNSNSYLKQAKSASTATGIVNLYTLYVVILWPYNLSVEFTIGNCLFGTVKLAKNADVDKYGYSGSCIGFDACSSFLLSNKKEMTEKMLLFLLYMTVHLSMLITKKIILRKSPTNGLDDSITTAETEYSIDIAGQGKK